MKEFADSAYVHAKIYGLRSKLLTADQYAALVADRDFARFFPGLTARAGPGTCSQLQQELFRRCIGGVLALAQASPVYEPVFSAFLRFFEARNVKLLLARAGGTDVPDPAWCDISPYAAFSLHSLGTVRGWDDLEGLARNTYLEQLGAGPARHRAVRIESGLDRYCLDLLRSAAERLPAPERPVLEESVLMRLELLKCLWAWRLTRYYGWTQEAADRHLALFAAPRLRDPAEPGLMRARAFARRLQELVRETGLQEDAEARLEQRAESAFCGYARGLFGRDVFSSACVAGYLWLLWCQIRNIFLVLEGIRFELPRETVRQMLVCEA